MRAQHSLDGALIGIGGLIGAGKSTLAIELGARLQLGVYPGPEIDDKLRADLHDFPERTSFVAQVRLLTQQFTQHQEIRWCGAGGVQDRTVLEDLAYTRSLFNRGALTPLERDTYMNLYRALSDVMGPPDLILFLDVAPETALRRIRDRGRGRQVETTVEFLSAMREVYEGLVEEISRTVPVIRVPYDSFWDPDVLARELCARHARLRVLDELSPDPPPSPQAASMTS